MTLGTTPRSVAATPLSKAPSSLEAPMKTWFTEAMRPRMASGDSTRTMTMRMTTLTPSARPATKSAAIESTKLVDRPKTSMETPKMATQTRKMGPARRLGGMRAVASMASRAPTEGAVRSRPRPMGPTPRMSLAKTGSRAMAPPKKTAKRSRAIEASSTWWLTT